MRFRHTSRVLGRIDDDQHFSGGYPENLLRAFRMRMQMIRAAVDETAFYQLKSLHYEKLKGNRRHQRSMRLNNRFRLILEVEKKPDGNVLVVVGIEDYH